MQAAITASLGFLSAVLWFDLMFDVQVVPHRRDAEVPGPVLDSIGAYYRRVTTGASPMGRLVGLVMLVLVALLVAQAVQGGTPGWVTVVSLVGALVAVGLAGGRIVPSAVRLGSLVADDAARSRLARLILRGHLACLALIVGVLAVQLSAA